MRDALPRRSGGAQGRAGGGWRPAGACHTVPGLARSRTADDAETTLEREVGRTAPGPGHVDDERGLAAAPPLAAWAALAGLLDLLVNQVALRLLPEAVERGQRLLYLEGGEVVRNVAAIAAVGALGALLWDLLRRRRWAPPLRRVVIASFGGLFLPSVALALVLPHARVSMLVVMLGIGSGSVLATLLALAPVRFASPPLLRMGLVALGSATLLAFGVLVVRLSAVGPVTAVEQEAVREVGEGLHLAALVMLGLALAPRPRARAWRDGVATALGLAVAAGVTAVLVWAPARLGPDFGGLFYGAQRLTLWLESAPAAYAAVLGPAAGLASAAALAADPARRQGGLGLLLALRAGFAPRSLDAVLALALGAGLVARSALALAAAYGRAARAARLGANGHAARAPGHGADVAVPSLEVERISEGAPPPPRSS